MPAHHTVLEFFAGDDWVIEGTLLSQNGTIFNPTGAVIVWVLISPDGETMGIPDVIIAREASGKVTITLLAEHTAAFNPGRYSDALRIVHDGSTSLFWTGQIICNANPEFVV